MSHEFAGSCHCGNITVAFHTKKAPNELSPRNSDSSFSVKNGTKWLSDPEGKIDIAVINEAALSLYPLSIEGSKYWICQRCGTTCAVTCEIDGSLHGAVNANCLDDPAAFSGSENVSTKTLDAENQLKQWSETWTRKVIVKEAWDVGL